MKKSLALLLLTTILAASIAGCVRRDEGDSTPTTTTTESALTTTPSPVITTTATPITTVAPVTTTPPVTTAPVTTTPPITTTPVTTPPVTTAPITTAPPTTTAPETTPETTPEPLPGNPEKYGFTEVPYKKLDAWFNFEEAHWSYWYTTQTNIGDSLNLSLLKPCTYDEATQNWVPSADAYEKGWRMGEILGSTLTPITGMSAVLAFTAPADGTYEFEFYYHGGKIPGTDSDGIQFLLFGDGRLAYAEVCNPDHEEGIYDPFVTKYVSLNKGERAYFIADPRENGNGDICKSISMIRVQRTIEKYIDNKNTYAFGYNYDEGSPKQGTNGWYAGYAETGSPLTSASIGSDPMPSDLLAGSTSFSSVKEDEIAMILWKAPKSGTYTVSVRGWWPDKDVFLSFYNDGEWITTLMDDFSFANHQMTCKLNKGEYFALLITRNEAFNGWGPNNDLEILIQRAS